MRTIMPVLVVLAIGVAGAMLGMSGFESAWGAEPPSVEPASSQVNESAGSVGVEEGPVEGPVNSGESSIVGIVVDGLQSLTDIAGAVLVLPVTLMNLGFPAWFSIPVGAVAEALVGIGIIEFATNRVWN